MTPQQLIDRARSAIGLPTAYWLGRGGKDPDTPVPGEWFTVNKMIEELQDNDPTQVPRLKDVAAAAGYSSDRWNEPLRACDCSGFSNWVVGVPRGGSNGLAYIWTQNMYDYTSQRVHDIFEPIAQARIGSLVVYPPGRAGAEYGHVGIVTEVANGAPTLVVHCSSGNFLETHDSIAQTGPLVFEQHAPVRYLWPRVLGAASQQDDA